MGGVTQNLTATLDPVDPEVRAAASRLATSIDDSSEVGRVVRSLLNDVAHGERVVVLHAFVKKTEATPEKDLRLARRRVKEVRDG